MRYTVSLVAMLALLSSVMTASGAISSKPVVSVIGETWTCKEGEGKLRFQVWTEKPVNEALRVAYAIGGTALSGADYRPVKKSVKIPAGEQHVNIEIDVKDDAILEGTETVVLTLVTDDRYDIQVQASTAVAEILSLDGSGLAFLFTARLLLRQNRSGTRGTSGHPVPVQAVRNGRAGAIRAGRPSR